MNRGERFEHQLIASVPTWASVEKYNNPTPPPRELWDLKGPDGKVSLVDLLSAADAAWRQEDIAANMLGTVRLRVAANGDPAVERLLKWTDETLKHQESGRRPMLALAANIDKIRTSLDRTRFTARPPYDLRITAPMGEPTVTAKGRTVQPVLALALECKSAGAEPRLPFAIVKENQRAGLLKAASGGAIAGLALEFPSDEVWLLPIDRFLEIEKTCGRNSLTSLLCQGEGIKIEVDEKRGRAHRYYRIDRLLMELGATPPVEATPEQQPLLSLGGAA